MIEKLVDNSPDISRLLLYTVPALCVTVYINYWVQRRMLSVYFETGFHGANFEVQNNWPRAEKRCSKLIWRQVLQGMFVQRFSPIVEALAS